MQPDQSLPVWHHRMHGHKILIEPYAVFVGLLRRYVGPLTECNDAKSQIFQHKSQQCELQQKQQNHCWQALGLKYHMLAMDAMGYQMIRK